jgi:hypothetical protein
LKLSRQNRLIYHLFAKHSPKDVVNSNIDVAEEAKKDGQERLAKAFAKAKMEEE